MKLIALFLISILSTIGISACQPEGGEVNVEYKIAPKELKFPRSGDKLYINVQTNADVSASSSSTWCEVMQETSQSSKMVKFAVSVGANDANEQRTATVMLTIAGNISETVSVIQEGNPLYIPDTQFNLDYNEQEFTVAVSASDEYDVIVDGSWMNVVSKSASQTKISVDKNNLPYERHGKLTFKTSKASHEVMVNQDGFTGPVPDPDMTGMESDAMTLMKNMTLGINLGNTLEATGGETAWGAPYTSENIIRYFKDLGFNAVRIPCSWNQNLEEGEGYVIKSAWMNRVKEVVDYVVDNDMYAILNIHWDGGWLENDITNGYDEEVDAKQHAIWTQIASFFRDYDEHLLFAGTNEPNVENASHMETLLKYEQTFIDAVRATGGRNAYRVLVFQGPSTDIDKTVQFMKTLPTDTVEGRLAAEVHYYTPPQFCLLEEDVDWGKNVYFWGDDNQHYATGAYAGRWISANNEAYMEKQMAKMKAKFWDNGIPVIIGEFGASSYKKCNLGTDQENEKAEEGYAKSLAAFSGAMVRYAKSNGCVPFYWHCQGDLIDRTSLKVVHPDTYNAILEAGNTQYPD